MKGLKNYGYSVTKWQWTCTEAQNFVISEQQISQSLSLFEGLSMLRSEESKILRSFLDSRFRRITEEERKKKEEKRIGILKINSSQQILLKSNRCMMSTVNPQLRTMKIRFTCVFDFSDFSFRILKETFMTTVSQKAHFSWIRAEKLKFEDASRKIKLRNTFFGISNESD